MFKPKIIKIEQPKEKFFGSLLHVTFQSENERYTWFADMTEDELKVRQFEEKMSHKLDDKEMEELSDCFDIKRQEGYHDGNEAGWDEASDRED